ncbi:hypothetical protein I310_00468 [Cryptococcus deuterogattii CA1014]|nr:hypothetical protein I310_00468 [Cryptococcus deuterogattii CA1014]
MPAPSSQALVATSLNPQCHDVMQDLDLRHLERVIRDINELRNKEEWMLSILRTTNTIMTTYNNTLLDISSEMNDLRCQVTELEEKVGTGNGGLERERTRKKNLVHAVVRETAGIPRNWSKPVYAAENWPDHDEEEAPDGVSYRMASFENLVSTAVRKCAEDDQFAQLKSKPTNDELRGRVIDYLNNVVREKKKAEAKKRTEVKVTSIKSRTARTTF